MSGKNKIALILLIIIVLALLNTCTAKKGTVTLLGVWGGQELEVMEEMFTLFKEQTGITVDFQGTRDLDAVLTTRVQAGNPPDLAALPGPGKMQEFAKSGKLIDLATIISPGEYRKDFGQAWLSLGTVDGKLAGTYIGASIKGLIWYSPHQLAAGKFNIPKTWDEMIAASKKISANGETPWAIGFESGAASGWPGTDWLENIFVRLNGPEKYKAWYEGQLPWTAPEVKNAFDLFGEIAADKKMLYGGQQYVLATNFGQAPGPVFAKKPKAYFHQQASFITSFIKDMYPDLKAVEDYRFFPFPAINPDYAKAVEAAGNVVSVFRDTPEARAFIKFLTGSEAQALLAKKLGWLATNRHVPLTAYTDELTRNAAEILNNAEIIVFDASDMMPGEINKAFWNAVMRYVEKPGELDKILQDLETTRRNYYK